MKHSRVEVYIPSNAFGIKVVQNLLTVQPASIFPQGTQYDTSITDSSTLDGWLSSLRLHYPRIPAPSMSFPALRAKLVGVSHIYAAGIIMGIAKHTVSLYPQLCEVDTRVGLSSGRDKERVTRDGFRLFTQLFIALLF